MLSFEPSKDSLKKLSDLSASIAVLASKIPMLEKSERDYIQRHVAISNIGASTRIENAVLTNAEIDWLDTVLTTDSQEDVYIENKKNIKNKLSQDRERSIEEVVGCREMLTLILEQYSDLFPLTETTLRGLHSELLKYYPTAEPYRGRYKEKSNSVVRFEDEKPIPVLTTSQPGLEAETAMHDLIVWYNANSKEEFWSVAFATEFVFRFLAIHPFEDGNGRLGRGLFHLALLHSSNTDLSLATPYLAIDRNIEIERTKYYLSLRNCSEGNYLTDPSGYRYENLLQFFIEVIKKSIDDFDYYRKKHHNLQRLTEAERKILACFKERPEKRLQTKDIIEILQMPRTTVNDALVTLTKVNFIQRYGRGPATNYQLEF